MTSHINIKNKQGMTKLAALLKQTGFGDVKVIVKPNHSITLTPNTDIDLSKGLSDLKAGRYVSFKSADDAISFLDQRNQVPKKSVNRIK